MPRFNVKLGVTITTSVEPDGDFTDPGIAGVEEFSDESYWYGETVSFDGGVIDLVIEATDEDGARAIAERFDNNLSFSDSDYEVERVDVMEVEEIEEPMDMDRAKTILTALIGRMTDLTDEEKAALEFVLESLTP